jgi:predicted ATPase
VLTPTQMLPRLQRRLSLLTTGATTLPDRQRTLRGAIAWSHDLLPEAERRLFARLSVFAGGWTLESAEAVCDPEGLDLDILDGLASLVDQSLVLRTEPAAGHPRFSMLETIREFGQERLADEGDLARLRRRHADHFLDLAIAAEPHLTGADQGDWLDRCDLEQANLRAAFRWAIDAGETGRAQEAAGALWRFWQQRGHLTEGRRWLEEVLVMPSGRRRPRPGPRPSPERAGSPGGRRTSRPPAGSTRRPWPSSGCSAIPPGPPTRSTTWRSWWPPSATSRAPSGCSRRACSCSGGPGTRPGRPGPTG